jgi:hypothetical protein
VSHRQLFEEAARLWFGRPVKPLCMPKPLSRVGLYVLDLIGRLIGHRPFERPWMGKYIDTDLRVDASRTRRRLGWEPSPRREILRRLPFLLENMKTDPVVWNHRNWMALKAVHLAPHLRIFRLLETHEAALVRVSDAVFERPDAQDRFPRYRRLGPEELSWSSRETFTHLKNSVRTQEKALFAQHCKEIAERRFRLGFSCKEVVGLAETLLDAWLVELRKDPMEREIDAELTELVTTTVRLGIDAIEDVFEDLAGSYHAPEELEA